MKVFQHGHSLAIRFSKIDQERIGLKAGDELEIEVREGELALKRPYQASSFMWRAFRFEGSELKNGPLVYGKPRLDDLDAAAKSGSTHVRIYEHRDGVTSALELPL